MAAAVRIICVVAELPEVLLSMDITKWEEMWHLDYSTADRQRCLCGGGGLGWEASGSLSATMMTVVRQSVQNLKTKGRQCM